jgi:hypothetical protein
MLVRDTSIQTTESGFLNALRCMRSKSAPNLTLFLTTVRPSESGPGYGVTLIALRRIKESKLALIPTLF